MSDLPTGTVTFLFTDIEGSTRLWAEHGGAMGRAVARHEELIRQVVEGHGGYVFFTAGDSFGAAFPTAHEGVTAAVEAQLAIASEGWGETPIRVRMGLHMGEAEERDADYFGPVVNETGRLMAAAHGGQIVATRTVAELAGGGLPGEVGFSDLGEVRLRDVDHPVEVVQVVHAALEQAFLPLRGLAETPNNLPSQLTSFVGRDRELDELGDLVHRARLVTLTGAGGSGKTRLVLQFAGDVLGEFPDGVWFVDLAVLDDPGLVPGMVALTVGVAEAPSDTIVDRLAERLEERKTLLVLDNCEHVLDEVASLALEVLKRTDAVRVVATSRQPLGVAGEHPYLIPTLEVPVEGVTDPASLAGYQAVELFRDRAVTAQPGFAITPGNATAVAQICQRLDGLPLALELAAARLTILDPEDLQRRLDDRLTVLAAGSRDRLPRHQTLAATLDWSYQLLTPGEQTILNRLSVFVGGFTLDATEHVCSGEAIDRGQILALVSGLVDKSLVVADLGVTGRRFRFLETIGEYAAGRLAEGGEQGDFEQRHAEYFRRLAVDSFDQVWGPDEVGSFDRLDEEWPNLRRSLQWHLDEGRTQDGQMMAGSLRYFFWSRYHVTEGLEWLQRFVEADPTPSPGRARALAGVAVASVEYSDLWEETIELARRFGSREELARTLINAGIKSGLQGGDWEMARERLGEALELAREAGNPAVLADAFAYNSAVALVADNDPARALALVEEGLYWARETGSPERVAGSVEWLGELRRHAGDLDGAEAALHEAQQLHETLGTKYYQAGRTEIALASVALDRGDTKAAVAHLLQFDDVVRPLVEEDREMWSSEHKPLLQWARVAATRGEHELATTLLAANHRVSDEWSGFGPYVAEVEQTVDFAREHLEPDQFDNAWGRGLRMTSSEALDHAVANLATGSA